jgi:hypothetical protein
MSTTKLVLAAQALGISNNYDLNSAWTKLSHSFASIAGPVHGIGFQANGRLDILLRQLEAEALEIFALPADKRPMLFIDQLSLFSEAWVIKTYEMVRAACQQLRRKGETDEALGTLKHRLGLVRMPMAKAEIQMADRMKTPLMLGLGDGSETKPYIADGSYIMPRTICGQTGSFCWVAVDIPSQRNVAISRRDLADELLAWVPGKTKAPYDSASA